MNADSKKKTLQQRASYVGALAAASVPLWSPNPYIVHLATLIAVYWILISGLNLVVGFMGLLSIGHVGLLAIGAYGFAILAGTLGWDPLLTLPVVGVVGGVCGFLLGLPALRLPGFYFAMATLAFSLMVGEFTLAQSGLTGGGAGIAAPLFEAPFDTPNAFYWLAVGVAALVTWMTWNVSRMMWGRGMIALRDSEVAGASVGVPMYRIRLTVFTFSGVTAGVGGALFASLQSYITPETFVFELGLFFFICIVIGGRGSILGPLMGTIVLTALPELVAPLARFGQLFYGVLLLGVVLLLPEGLGQLPSLLHLKRHKAAHVHEPLIPNLDVLKAAIRAGREA
ncbi:branched-chain amino acid ABC transporter permease [Paraburkholderia fungorum]|jgi:branched-chain amino acid transport system permease protein|uniref:branched-chain amino acid ABC transporter permease n=1 Tax=Paraburkholderia fungorum TaxID=134537 RepID=UPI0038BADFE1